MLARLDHALGVRATVPSVRVWTYVGFVALLLALAHVVLFSPTLVLAGLAAVATAGLARSPRLGPLGAALFVVVAIPYARGADTFTVDLAGIPIRPQDAAIGIGLAWSLLLVLRRPLRFDAIGWLAIAFLALAPIAVVVGLSHDFPARDILRDVRWWLMYAAVPIALLGGTTRSALIRGLMLGTLLFSATVLIAALGPVLTGGLKHQELLYDRGTLRMQFGNSAFLVPAIALATFIFVRRRSRSRAILLGLLSTAVVLSVTRTSIVATLGVVGLIVAWDVLRVRSSGRALKLIAMRVSAVAGVLVVALAAGVAVDTIGTPASTAVSTSGGQAGEQPMDRILFQDDRSNLAFA